MSFELLRAEYNAQRKIIENAIRRQDEIITEMENCNEDDYDWISVKKAAKLVDVSLGLIYRKIDNGELETKHFASKKFVKKSQIYKINDYFNK